MHIGFFGGDTYTTKKPWFGWKDNIEMDLTKVMKNSRNANKSTIL
jgi:hypothetical protein